MYVDPTVNHKVLANPRRYKVVTGSLEGRIRIKEAASILALSPWTVRLRIRQGELAAHKDGSVVVIDRTEIERYIDEVKRSAK
jgi:excisionase family DNA binding protein